MRDCEETQTKKRMAKLQKEVEKRCFWTWPWGHCYCKNWTNSNLPYWQKKCCHCGRKAYA